MLRPYLTRADAQRLVGDDGHFLLTKSIEQIAPLRHEHGWHNQREGLLACERDRERDVRLAQTDFIREQRAAMPPDDRAQAFSGGNLVRCEPRRPRGTRLLRRRFDVEQRARRARDDLAEGCLARRPKCDSERLRDWNEVLRQNARPACGDLCHRGEMHQPRGRRRARARLRGASAPARPVIRAAGSAGRVPLAH